MPAAISRDVSPNRGSTVDADQTIPNQQSQEEWRREYGIDVSKQVRLVKVSHMRYQYKDMDTNTIFLKDFGMRVVKRTDDKIWFAGYGDDPFVLYAQRGEEDKFLGGCFLVETEADLEKAAQLPGAGKIEELTDFPGGGKGLTIIDPGDFPLNLIWGQEPASKEGRGQQQQAERLVYNYEDDKTRKGQFQRFKDGPAAVHKLGHFGLMTTNFEKMWNFYLRNFNLVPSDWLHVDDADGKKRDVALFAHIDRGEDYVDHHTLFMSSNPTSHVHHCSFEVHDFDTQLLGHKWLVKKGYNLVWGVGRHILGSQIFDYWYDPAGFMVEHYADGDLLNNKTPVGRGPAGHESLSVWGPDVPATFLD